MGMDMGGDVEPRVAMGVGEIAFDARGLAPAIVQGVEDGAVRMLGYMNREALERTLRTGQVWFWSRSRGDFWRKGETSGHWLEVIEVLADCDNDAILVRARPHGPTCHTGAESCFHRAIRAPEQGEGEGVAGEGGEGGAAVIDELVATIAARRRERPAGSYTTKLLDEGVDRIGRKIGEEAAEVIIAAKNGDGEALAWEVADLWYHSLVLLAAVGVEPELVWRQLRDRRGGGPPTVGGADSLDLHGPPDLGGAGGAPLGEDER